MIRTRGKKVCAVIPISSTSLGLEVLGVKGLGVTVLGVKGLGFKGLWVTPL